MGIEEWRPVKGYESRYLISNFGNLKSIDFTDSLGRKRKGRILKLAKHRCGYVSARISLNEIKDTLRIHREVAIAFIPNPNNLPQVNHKDGNKINNYVDNLEWCDNSFNQRHAIKTGLKIIKYREEATCFKSRIFVYDSTGNQIDILVGNRDMKEKGFDWRNVNACLYGTRKKHRGCTFKREKLEIE